MSPTYVLACCTISVLLWLLWKLMHVAYYHPLSHVPGPKWAAASRLFFIRHLIRGSTSRYLSDLHKFYGPVVRYSPNEVSFICGATAWTEIYGSRIGALKNVAHMVKDPAQYPILEAAHIGNASDKDHVRFRRTLSYAFSDNAISNQEKLILAHVAELLERLHELIKSDENPVDIAKWYVRTSTDVVTDLTFGELLQSVKNSAMQQYIDKLSDAWRGFRLKYILTYWPWAKYLGNVLINKTTMTRRGEFRSWTYDKVYKRLNRESQHPDIIQHILAHKDENQAESMTIEEIQTNSLAILTAGSETTSGLLSGLTYLLLRNSSVLSKLQTEVRTKWQSLEEITLRSAADCRYLNATINEGLRYFPPVPTGINRLVPAGGRQISGFFIPEGTVVSVSIYIANRSELNFKDADLFKPERWLGEEQRYEDDLRNACQPFSYGPRNCIGKGLALAECRLILAQMIWSFDMTLDERSHDWITRCKSFIVWDIPELAIHLRPSQRSKKASGEFDRRL